MPIPNILPEFIMSNTLYSKDYLQQISSRYGTLTLILYLQQPDIEH